jgi:hypothetical protein
MVQTGMTAGLRVNGANSLVCVASGSNSCSNAGSAVIPAGGMVSFFASGQNNITNAVIRFSAQCQ